jgi:hypothetical protein
MLNLLREKKKSNWRLSIWDYLGRLWIIISSKGGITDLSNIYNRICTAPQTKNALFLRALLEELRLHGVFEEISKRIEYYLEAQSVSELYEKILSRMEKVNFI